MQVMPRDGLAANFVCANGPCFASRPTIKELQDPQFNLEFATRMLSSLQSRFGSLREALKAYGPKDVGYYYADKVLAISWSLPLPFSGVFACGFHQSADQADDLRQCEEG